MVSFCFTLIKYRGCKINLINTTDMFQRSISSNWKCNISDVISFYFVCKTFWFFSTWYNFRCNGIFFLYTLRGHRVTIWWHFRVVLSTQLPLNSRLFLECYFTKLKSKSYMSMYIFFTWELQKKKINVGICEKYIFYANLYNSILRNHVFILTIKSFIEWKQFRSDHNQRLINGGYLIRFKYVRV